VGEERERERQGGRETGNGLERKRKTELLEKWNKEVV
jgi:hypothetical protein